MTDAVESVRVRSFRDLKVWQKAFELSIAIYRLICGFPQSETFGLTSQMRRSAVSIPSNIAEGQGRASTRDFGHFLSIARGSNCELQTQLGIARALGFGDSKLFDQAENLSHEVGKMLFTMMGKLKARIG